MQFVVDDGRVTAQQLVEQGMLETDSAHTGWLRS